jgi:hypothetical protein
MGHVWIQFSAPAALNVSVSVPMNRAWCLKHAETDSYCKSQYWVVIFRRGPIQKKIGRWIVHQFMETVSRHNFLPEYIGM